MAKFNNNEKPMHFGATKSTFKKADELRNRMTNAEHILWQHVNKKKILGLRFRRQHSIGQFIVDFYCHQIKLVVEVDGEIHDNKHNIEYDKQRTYELKKLGLEVIRFKNDQVLNQIDSVIQEIKKYCEFKLQNLID
jgi:very-short-patch-repair endonuclease